MVLSYSVNYLAVLVAAIVGFVISWLWWGPLFGKAWMKHSGMTKSDINKAKKKGMAGTMVVAFIAQLVMAWVLAVLLISTSAAAMGMALTLAFFVWLGFVATIGIGMVLWHGKSMGLFWINNLGWLVTLLVMAIVLSFWG